MHKLYKARMHDHTTPSFSLRPLTGIRILSLALNLPGPAALLRCQEMGAQCTKLEPVAMHQAASADAMHTYSSQGYEHLHRGITVIQANLKTQEGQNTLHKALSDSDVLLTSFRPNALAKLGLDWTSLHSKYPQLNMVRIFGSTDPAHSNHAGHDLTYQAEANLVTNGQLPTSLFADMSGALMASEAVLQALFLRSQNHRGHCLDIGLAEAAQWLALPRQWGMTTPQGDVGGAHAGYRMYRCLDAWVALAALEPHFAQRVCAVAGLAQAQGTVEEMRLPSTHSAIEAFFQGKTSKEIAAMAAQSDIPLQVILSDSK